MPRAFICGLAGQTLEGAERAFLAETCPAGIILFARNVGTPGQVKRLISEARNASGGGERLLVLVDQEGGRVQRLAQPHWRAYPPAAVFGQVFENDIGKAARCAYLCARLIAQDLHALGIDTSCAPVLDIPSAGADKVIGDRAYGTAAATVIRLGGAVADGLLAGGVLPVMKHIPGHGRAGADSHFALPAVDASLSTLIQTDFAPFRALRHLPAAMTAHVVLTAVDPIAPVTVSKAAISEAIRGAIGFEGLLISDDLSMHALSGSLAVRTSAAIGAGCDIALHCNGLLHQMEEVAGAAPSLAGNALCRFENALSHLVHPEAFDLAEAEYALALALSLAAPK